LVWVKQGTFELDSDIVISYKDNVELIFNKGVVLDFLEEWIELLVEGSNKVRISGLVWDGLASQQAPSGLRVVSSEQFTLDHSFIKGSFEDGIKLVDSHYFNIERVLIEEISWSGIFIEECLRGFIRACSIVNVRMDPDPPEGAGIYIDALAEKILIFGNYIWDANWELDFGIKVHSENEGYNLILGNSFEGVQTPISCVSSDEVAHNVCV